MRIKGTRRICKKQDRPKIVLDAQTGNQHINHINTIYSLSKNKVDKAKKLQFSISFLDKKIKSHTKLLNEIANQGNPEKIFVTFEDFDLYRFKELGAKGYSEMLLKEISYFKDAKKYAKAILKKL